jgi:hypothetical protein
MPGIVAECARPYLMGKFWVASGTRALVVGVAAGAVKLQLTQLMAGAALHVGDV